MNILKIAVWFVMLMGFINVSFQKKANELKQQALTPAILEKMWIEKWDGKLPVYGQVPTIFKDISK